MYVSIYRCVQGVCACAYIYVHTKSKLLIFKLADCCSSSCMANTHSLLHTWTVPGHTFFLPRMTTMILAQLTEFVTLHLPWAGQFAGLWCSSPEQCGDGHSAWLPPVPYESLPAVVFHLLLLVPVIPPSPGNAEKNIHHNRNSEDTSRDQQTWMPPSASHQNLSPCQSSLAPRNSALNTHFTDFSENCWCPVFLNIWPYFINLIKYSWPVPHNHQWILHLPRDSGSVLENCA